MATRTYGPRSFSDESVTKATGKNWKQWWSALDKWGVKDQGHTATAKHLHERHKVSSWWAQAITARYEWEHGLKKPKTKK
jgi:hypothetical protein